MDETDFACSARRSHKEVVSAILSPSTTVAGAHWQLSLLHAARALKALDAHEQTSSLSHSIMTNAASSLQTRDGRAGATQR